MTISVARTWRKRRRHCSREKVIVVVFLIPVVRVWTAMPTVKLALPPAPIKKRSTGKHTLSTDYKTVRTARKASSSERLLNPSSTSTELVSTLAFEEEDERIMHCVKVHDTRDRLNKTMSFDPATKLCVVCIPPAHQTFRAGNDGPGGAGRI